VKKGIFRIVKEKQKEGNRGRIKERKNMRFVGNA
jgi:hypothetical protein